MNRRDMEYADSQAAIVALVTKHALGACKIPEEWKPLVAEIVSSQIHSLMLMLGNLELVYRRTLMHAEELREIETGQTKPPK